MGRSEATARGSTSRNRSASSSVLNRPSDILNEPRALSASNPRASNTWEGWPAWIALHALPDEMAMPCLVQFQEELDRLAFQAVETQADMAGQAAPAMADQIGALDPFAGCSP